MVAEVEGDEALGHGTVDLEDGILRVAVVLGDIDVAEVGRLGIFAALLRLVGYLHGDGGEHLQRVAQLRVVARTDPQLLERHLDGHAAVLIELVAAEDIELARGAAVEHSLQDVLQALDDAHEDAHLHLAVVVAHHRHGNGLQEPRLLRYRDEVVADVALDVGLLGLGAALRGFRRRPARAAAGGFLPCLLLCHGGKDNKFLRFRQIFLSVLFRFSLPSAIWPAPKRTPTKTKTLNVKR